ncbi:MAG TPA: hypothetical protein VFS43_07860 [Polyangiaceae bacterium]|nr:hypothetical protein [Polyangiaceae bacterium]
MSVKHATVSAWQRQHEDGSYEANLEGWSLHVSWKMPATIDGERGFVWKAKGPDGQERSSSELFEEPEIAMADAEAATKVGQQGGQSPTGEL